eukprot:PhM_4_TR2118/c1_g3_i2/m.57370
MSSAPNNNSKVHKRSLSKTRATALHRASLFAESTTHTANSQSSAIVADSSSKRSDGRASAASRTVAALQQREQKYSMNLFTLVFKNPQIEKRYFKYCYIDTPFYGGKIAYFAVLASMLSMHFFYHDDHSGATFHAEDVFIFAMMAVGLVVTATTFVEKLNRFREVLFLVFYMTVGSAYIYTEAYHRAQLSGSHAWNVGFTMSMCVIPGVRLVRLIFYVPIVNFTVLVVGSFLNSSHWEKYQWTEWYWWPLYSTPLLLVYYLERRVRHAFEMMDESQNELDAMQLRIGGLKDMVIGFFPKTVTRDLLMNPLVGSHPPKSSDCSSSIVNGIHFRAYPTSLIIVSDVAGFTGWVARTDSSIVIDVLSDMFYTFDLLAEAHRVEKVTTVGDSYVGVIFGGDTAKRTDGARCLHAVQFGLGVLTALDTAAASEYGATGLRHRVGVHIGDLVGGFVGLSPPRFDVFGDAVEHTKMMEATCTVGTVHVSEDVMMILDDGERWGTPNGAVSTEHGKTITGWTRTPSHSSGEFDLTMHSPTAGTVGPDSSAADAVSPIVYDSQSVRSIGIDVNKADRILANLMSLSKGGSDEQQHAVGGSFSSRVKFDAAANDSTTGDDDYATIKAIYKTNWDLTFCDEEIEASYSYGVRKSPGEDRIITCQSLLTLYVFLMFIIQGCLDTNYDRTYLGSVPLMLLVLLSFQVWGSRSWPHYSRTLAILVWTMFMMPAAASTFISSKCNRSGSGQTDVAEYRASNIIGGHAVLATLSCQFLYDLAIWKKILLLFCGTVFTYLQVLVREIVIEDGALFYDPLIGISPLGYAWIAISTEMSLRRAFVSRNVVEHMLRSTGKHSHDMRRALEIMLPDFVTDKMMRMDHGGKQLFVVRSDQTEEEVVDAEEDVEEGEGEGEELRVETIQNKYADRSSETASSSKRSARAANSSSNAAVSRRDDDLLWNYPAVCAVFLSFQPPRGLEDCGDDSGLEGSASTPLSPSKSSSQFMSEEARQNKRAHFTRQFRKIKTVLETVERSMAQCGVRKVKTVGPTMLCVAGLDAASSGADAVRCVVAAVITVVQDVFPESLETEAWTWTVGIHCGACFGAVMGVQGLTFDVFGDTINTASRMQTTAAKNTVQMTMQSVEWLGGRENAPYGCSIVAVPAVTVKGKGTMDVFRLDVPRTSQTTSSISCNNKNQSDNQNQVDNKSGELGPL